MNIYTDDIQYAEQILWEKPSWKSASHTALSNDTTILANSIFHKNNKIYTSFINTNSVWKHLFIVKNADKSHFDILVNLLKKNISLPDGLLCIAGSGSGFHGFRSREWLSLPGNIHLSAFLAPQRRVERFHAGFLSLSAVSVIQALDSIEIFKNKAAVRWVNDIVINNAKVGGVLTQTQTQGMIVTGAVLGVGINVETTPQVKSDIFVPQAACLLDYSDDLTLCNQAIVFNHLINFLSDNYRKLINGKFYQILDFYRQRSIVINREVIIYSDPVSGDPQEILQGKAVSIGENLELIIEGFNEPVTKGRLVVKNIVDKFISA